MSAAANAAKNRNRKRKKIVPSFEQKNDAKIRSKQVEDKGEYERQSKRARRRYANGSDVTQQVWFINSPPPRMHLERRRSPPQSRSASRMASVEQEQSLKRQNLRQIGKTRGSGTSSTKQNTRNQSPKIQQKKHQTRTKKQTDGVRAATKIQLESVRNRDPLVMPPPKLSDDTVMGIPVMPPPWLVALRGELLRVALKPDFCTNSIFDHVVKRQKDSSSESVIYFARLSQKDARSILRQTQNSTWGTIDYVIKEYDPEVAREVCTKKGICGRQETYHLKTWDLILKHEAAIYKDVTNRLLEARNTPNIIYAIDSVECRRPHRRSVLRIVLEAGYPPYGGGPLDSIRPMDMVSPQIVFPLLYTLRCFELIGLTHNDLHLSNILVREYSSYPIPVMGYRVSERDMVILRNVTLLPLIFDFDRATKRATALDPTSLPFPPDGRGVIDGWVKWHRDSQQDRKDTFMLGCNLMNFSGTTPKAKKIIHNIFFKPDVRFVNRRQFVLRSARGGRESDQKQRTITSLLYHPCVPGRKEGNGLKNLSIEQLPSRTPGEIFQMLARVVNELSELSSREAAGKGGDIMGDIEYVRFDPGFLDRVVMLPSMYELPGIPRNGRPVPPPPDRKFRNKVIHTLDLPQSFIMQSDADQSQTAARQ